MFTTTISRAAHRATTTSNPVSVTAVAALSTSASHCTGRPSPHQRRHSSSKASSSCPPDSTSKPAPTAKEARPPLSAPRTSSKSSKSRAKGGYRRTAQALEVKKPAEPVDQYAGLPSVAPIQNLTTADISLSNFFSLHRPLALSTGIPPPSTTESFSSLFTNGPPKDSWDNGNSAERRPENRVFSLNETSEALESGAQGLESDGLRWEVIHESPSNDVKHLDGPPRLRTLEELVSQFKPFKTPPPPRPMPDKKVSARGRPKKKTYTATITVTESTYANGQKTYTASSSPITPQPEPRTSKISALSNKHRWSATTSRGRRALDEPTSQIKIEYTDFFAPITEQQSPSPTKLRQVGMWMISVKRQRKLKMKKHKYKKLMKRTRNLRRRIERQS